jgi:hypothetical protein
VKIPLSVLLRLLQYAAVAFATIVVTLIGLRVLGNPGGKGPSTTLVIACAVVIGLGGVADGVYRLLSETLGGVSYNRRLVVEDNLKGLLVSLAQDTSIPWTEIGLTTFIVRWTVRHPFGRVQVRVARLRMRGTPRPTSVLWTRKKGVLGRCWRNRRDEDVDHHHQYLKYVNCTKKQWKGLDQDVREHLSYDDFLAIREFGYVLATPIFDHDSQYRGCLVIQVAPRFRNELAEGRNSRLLLHLSADTIGALLFEP